MLKKFGKGWVKENKISMKNLAEILFCPYRSHFYYITSHLFNFVTLYFIIIILSHCIQSLTNLDQFEPSFKIIVGFLLSNNVTVSHHHPMWNLLKKT